MCISNVYFLTVNLADTLNLK